MDLGPIAAAAIETKGKTVEQECEKISYSSSEDSLQAQTEDRRSTDALPAGDERDSQDRRLTNGYLVFLSASDDLYVRRQL